VLVLDLADAWNDFVIGFFTELAMEDRAGDFVVFTGCAFFTGFFLEAATVVPFAAFLITEEEEDFTLLETGFFFAVPADFTLAVPFFFDIIYKFCEMYVFSITKQISPEKLIFLLCAAAQRLYLQP